MFRYLLVLTILTSTLSAEPREIGEASANSSRTAAYWRNWVFAGTIAIIAGVGLYVLSLDNGKNPASSSH